MVRMNRYMGNGGKSGLSWFLPVKVKFQQEYANKSGDVGSSGRLGEEGASWKTKTTKIYLVQTNSSKKKLWLAF